MADIGRRSAEAQIDGRSPGTARSRAGSGERPPARRAAAAPDPTTAALRGFSRFYTRQLGLLGAGLLDSRFSLSQARVLYELAHRGPITAGTVARDLGLDPGYLSRMLKAFERDGLLERRPLPDDLRSRAIRLSPAGRAAQRALERASQAQAAAMVAALDAPDRGRLRAALATVQALLEPPAGPAQACPSDGHRPDARQPDAHPVVLRPHRPGDIGWVVHRHGVLYAAEYGLDERFEALVAEIGAAFLRGFEPAGERAFIAERAGRILGAAFAVRESPTVMKIRLVYVEPEARGLGLGKQMTQACIDFARAAGYRRITLWTNSILVEARRIYQAAGFRKLDENRYDDFGRTGLVGEHWAMDLEEVADLPAAS